MTKTMMDVQQVERHRADHRSGEQTGAKTPDVSDYLTNGLLQSTVHLGLQRINVIVSVTNYDKYQLHGPRSYKVFLKSNEII